MRTVRVPLGERSYQIHVGPGLLGSLGDRCRRLGLGARCAVITDPNAGAHFLAPVLASLRAAGFEAVSLEVPAGESAKSLPVVGRCHDALSRHRLERKSFVVALGGGCVGDLTGFVAATYLRGVPFVQVPTTLLSQVDSSVGGKTGINIAAGKNLVGAFHQPRLVLCDLDTLATLPDREYRAGLAEVIKYGIIYDAALFRRLEKDLDRLLARDLALLTAVVARSCAIKADVVGQDETESGLRAILNYGHTIGHALENISGYGRYLHGEAISLGQVAAAFLSNRLTGLPAAEAERIRVLFDRAGLPTTVRLDARRRTRLLGAMRLDKKVSAGEIKFVLARRLGSVVWGQRVPEALVQEALDALEP